MDEVDFEESDGEYGDLSHVSDSKNRNPISLKIHHEGRLVIMELDTGPAVSVMSEGVYQKYLRHVPLKDTTWSCVPTQAIFSRPSFTINTTHGLYQYQRLPYAVASAPTIWLRAMNQVLDDIIVVGRSMEEYLERLAAVLKRPEEYNLRANWEICNFLRSAVEYLGHVISTYLEGLH